MTSGRASIFDDEPNEDLDLSGFEPKKTKPVQPAETPEKVRALAEANNFPSRAPAKPKPQASGAAASRTAHSRATFSSMSRQPRRPWTSSTGFPTAQGWVLGETLEHALQALERELAAKT